MGLVYSASPDRMMDRFLQMVTKQYHSSDFDSDHPTCSWLIKKHHLDRKQGMWLSLLTMAFYDEASAWVAFNQSDPFTVPANCKLPIDKNRRNLYGESIVKHLTDLCDQYRLHKEWPKHAFVGDRGKDWFSLKFALSRVWGNGRFAVYNTADMLHKVNSFPVVVNELENKSSSGPADAIWRISQCDRKNVLDLDKHGDEICQIIVKTGLRPRYTNSDHGTVESVLCNFSGMCRGKYYPGRNIDRQQGRIIRIENMSTGYRKLMTTLWEARQAVFLRKHLGEYNNWVGVNRDRLKHFAATGEMLCPEAKR